jgi:hypothetical protein
MHTTAKALCAAAAIAALGACAPSRTPPVPHLGPPASAHGAACWVETDTVRDQFGIASLTRKVYGTGEVPCPSDPNHVQACSVEPDLAEDDWCVEWYPHLTMTVYFGPLSSVNPGERIIWEQSAPIPPTR